MQLNATTEYAVRCILFLAQNDGIRSSKEVSDAINVSREFIQRIMQKLRAGGLVINTMGAKGGYALAKKPEDISVYDVLITIGDTMRINKCLEDDEPCDLGRQDVCKMRKFYVEFQAIVDSILKKTSIYDILNEKVDYSKLCLEAI